MGHLTPTSIEPTDDDDDTIYIYIYIYICMYMCLYICIVYIVYLYVCLYVYVFVYMYCIYSIFVCMYAKYCLLGNDRKSLWTFASARYRFFGTISLSKYPDKYRGKYLCLSVWTNNHYPSP